ncbi:hypothetical protein [Streptomyces acidiscabies]|uniref:hypothetical protein n=1 Tax=Streptomyces acidiscabies TaxID=42234 RepID=UPI0038F7379E
MSSTESGPVRGGWLDPGKGFRDDVQPRKRQLALALRDLCRLLRSADPDKSGDNPPLQGEAAARLGCSSGELSRYLNRARIPRQEFVRRLYAEARADATVGGQDVGITLESLLALHATALGEQRGCEYCTQVGERLDALTQQLHAPCPECARYRERQKRDATRLRSARRETTRLRAAMAEMKTEQAEMRVTEAGLRADLTALRAQALLPVPRPPRDRQQSTKDTRAARQLVAQATELNSTGREDLASTLIRQSTAEVMTPAETALVVVELRRHPGGDRLADDLIHVYGRDQGKEYVIAVALGLHEEGATDDVGAILRASLGHRAGTVSSSQAASTSYHA